MHSTFQRKSQREGGKNTAYVSKFTQFMNSYLADHPEVVRDRRKGWYIFWDRQVDFDEMETTRKELLSSKGYVYF